MNQYLWKKVGGRSFALFILITLFILQFILVLPILYTAPISLYYKVLAIEAYIVPIVLLIVEIFYTFRTIRGPFIGVRCENDILDLIKQLPDYHPIPHFLMQGVYGDIDLITVGPAGVFVIEAKKVRNWLRRLPKFIAQADRGAQAVSSLIVKQTGIQHVVYAAVVFCDDFQRRKKRVERVLILNMKQVVPWITQSKPILTGEQQVKIYRAIIENRLTE